MLNSGTHPVDLLWRDANIFTNERDNGLEFDYCVTAAVCDGPDQCVSDTLSNANKNSSMVLCTDKAEA